jgi:hypothetical protein
LQIKSGILRIRGLCCWLDDIERNTEKEVVICRLIEEVKDGMYEGSCSVEGRGILILFLATTPPDHRGHWPEPGMDRICLVIEGNGEGTQEFKRVGLCRLPEWTWKEVFWAPRMVILTSSTATSKITVSAIFIHLLSC